jgi:DNA polymerase-3 subunit delta
VQLRPEQLESSLREALAPVYFISGEDPLRVLEAADAVRTRAREQGYGEREVLTVQSGFEWASLDSAAGSLSLFSSRRLLELRLPSGKPGDAGARVLRAWAEQPPEDTLLLITAGKLDAPARRSQWVQALDRAGVVVFVWPLDARQLPAWVRGRMQRYGLVPDREAIALLVDRVEGNLLACAQEIDKLYLLHGAGPVEAGAILESVADNARFDVYRLLDSALAGEAVRCTRMLQGLQAEGVASPVVLWALARDIRQLTAMAGAVAGGEPVAKVLARFRIWQARKTPFSRALGRLSVAACRHLLRHCARIDRVIKGQAAGNEWNELLQLTLSLAGAAPLPAGGLSTVV